MDSDVCFPVMTNNGRPVSLAEAESDAAYRAFIQARVASYMHDPTSHPLGERFVSHVDRVQMYKYQKDNRYWYIVYNPPPPFDEEVVEKLRQLAENFFRKHKAWILRMHYSIEQGTFEDPLHPHLNMVLHTRGTYISWIFRHFQSKLKKIGFPLLPETAKDGDHPWFKVQCTDDIAQYAGLHGYITKERPAVELPPPPYASQTEIRVKPRVAKNFLTLD